MHPPWASSMEDIELIRYGTYFIIYSLHLWRYLHRMDFLVCLTMGLHCRMWWLTVIYGELGSQEIGSQFSNISIACSTKVAINE
uniref:Tubby-like F-box protein n=1 Tax=Rhizophora mucronata TaxID=61149 RepID=A0A2P2N4G2_RHIMU